MEISDPISAVLKRKTSDLWSIRCDATVYEAIALMSLKNIGALPVVAGTRLVGVMSERDYTRQVILQGKASRTTPVSDIMTREPACVGPADTVAHAMRLMTDCKVRHLPVLQDGELRGIVSIGDLVQWTISAQGALIDQLESYILHAYPV
jgi:CBS domain-containing protein